MDGSFHDWLEDRGGKGCLMHLVDDATSTALFSFSKEETTWAAANLLRGVLVIGELRTKVSSNKVRLPDVAVVLEDEALHEDLRTTPPPIAIEIKSPDDRIHRVMERLKDFLAMGVANIRLLDPIERVAYTYGSNGLTPVETDRIAVADSPVYLDIAEIFASLD